MLFGAGKKVADRGRKVADRLSDGSGVAWRLRRRQTDSAAGVFTRESLSALELAVRGSPGGAPM
ncbi:hypothetical protein DIE06_19690 [Burkholderia sp. Bp8998]|nr:hypothetical protein DIE06_19690 [Burkholderia sp. Bp8998]